MYNHVIDYVNSSISIRQFGFLRKHSTLHQLLIFLNATFKSLNTKSQMDVAYLDFKKAFDTVPHNELLLKLWSFGFTGNVWKSLRAYLINRVQCVSINNSQSALLPVLSGVPQGSILGPMLFLVFVNDLPKAAATSLFADDAKCAHSITTVSDCLSLQQDLNNLVTWSTSWSLLFNEQKCSILRFCSPRHTIPFVCNLNGKSVVVKDSHRDLGVIISTDLQWSAHYCYIMSRAYKVLYLLRRVFGAVKCVLAKNVIYLSLVRSQLLYCSPVWRPYLLKDIKALEGVQRRATKFVLNDYSSNYRERLINLNILPLMMQLEINDILFFIKCIKEPSRSFNISDYVMFCASNTHSSTYLKLRHSLSKSNRARHFFFNRLPRLWNSLPLVDTDLSLPTL